MLRAGQYFVGSPNSSSRGGAYPASYHPAVMSCPAKQEPRIDGGTDYKSTNTGMIKTYDYVLNKHMHEIFTGKEGWLKNTVKRHRLIKPSGTMKIADGNKNYWAGCYNEGQLGTPHNKKMNVCFHDGHVEQTAKTKYGNQNVFWATISKWNGI